MADSRVQGRKARLVDGRKLAKVAVADLLMAADAAAAQNPGWRERVDELVPVAEIVRKSGQYALCILEAGSDRLVGHRDPNEAQLGEGAAEHVGPRRGKPRVCPTMESVNAPEEPHHCVHVQEELRPQRSSALRRAISAAVTFRPLRRSGTITESPEMGCFTIR